MVRCRLGISQRLAAGSWLSLSNPYQINGDKKKNDEQRTTELMRYDFAKRPFIHPGYLFIKFERFNEFDI